MFIFTPMKILSHLSFMPINPPHYCHFIFDIQFFRGVYANKIFTHSLPMRYADFPTLVMLWTTPL